MLRKKTVREVKSWKCDYCGQIYEIKDDAEECSKLHLFILNLKAGNIK
jgi:hypothetical protein